MKIRHHLAAYALAATATLAAATPSLAQSNPAYVRLGQVNAARFVPDSGPAPHVAFITAHRTGNTIGSSTCTELAARGFMAICFETRYRNDDIGVQWEKLPLDVKAVMDYARRQPGINRVILLGQKVEEHSDDSKGYQRMERRYGSFMRVIALSSDIDPDAVTAAYKDGVLHLILPKTEESRARRINIAAASA